MPSSMDRYLSGELVIGEELTREELAQWFADEKEATTDLRGSNWTYEYHALNRFYGYEELPKRRFSNVLSLGGGDGSELLPIIEQLGQITILEPSENLRPAINAKRIAPNIDCSIPFPENTFDLVTSFGVLHHIPNVSAAIKELYRCTTAGGFVLLTDPVISMGDWSKPRPGLTKHERGIPLDSFRLFIKEAGFKIIAERKCMFAPILYVNRRFHLNAYNSRAVVLLDFIACKFPFWTHKYHAQSFLDRFRPIGVFYVLTK